MRKIGVVLASAALAVGALFLGSYVAPAASMRKAKALDGVGWLANSQGDRGRAEAVAEEGLKLGAEAALGNVVRASFKHILAEAAWLRGDHEQARELLEESLVLHREAENRLGIAWSLGSLANVLGDLGHHGRATQLYQEGLALTRRLGAEEMRGAYMISMGYEYLLHGDYERATALNEEAASWHRKRGHRGGLQYALDNLGWAALLQGNRERAKALHEESLALCQKLDDKVIAAESLEGLACVAGIGGEAERAARLFGVAGALREAVGYHQTPRERALREPYLKGVRSRLDESTWDALFTVGQTMTLEEGVEYALATGGSVPPTAPAHEEQGATVDNAYSHLTRREREVASLVAQGLTNSQIASELVISERTVDNHVSNIFKKLGLTSREQLAARLN